MRKRIVIIGGVAAGASAAAKARRANEEAEIVMFESGPYMSFANCGLPYYLGREITNRNALFVADSETFARRFRIDVRGPREYENGHLENAVNIPVDEIRDRLNEIPDGRPMVIYCAGGYRAHVATLILRNHGFEDVRNLYGGYELISRMQAGKS